MANELVPSNPGEFLIYQTEDGRTRVQVRVDRDTAWLSLNQMADLFQRDKSVISRHIANVFEEGELRRDSVVAEFATTAADGKTYRVDHYNLDVIISVGYRVKSLRGTFRAVQAALPQPVDQHFADAIDELKKIEGEAKKKPGRKKKGGEK